MAVSRIPVITGIGLVTPLAAGAAPTWDALLAGRFIADHARSPLAAQGPDRIHFLAARAASEAVAEAGWSDRACAPGRTALVVGTSKGAVEEFTTPPPLHMPMPPYVVAGDWHLWGIASVAGLIRQSLPIVDGPVLTLSAACASGLHALIRAAMLIHCGEADRVLVVAAEASVNELFLGSFKRLGVLPPEGSGCRPFDERRDGFLMSEAAAAVCLERAENHAPARAYARVDRFSLLGDASHMTRSDLDAIALRRMIRTVANARPVDFIHAHGTGTIANDPVELAAFDEECVAGEPASPPRVYSHKAALGHSLGAAGLVSVVLNCLAHARGVIPSNVRTEHPLATRTVRLVREPESLRVRRSIAVAAGFGGPMAAVSLVSAGSRPGMRNLT